MKVKKKKLGRQGAEVEVGPGKIPWVGARAEMGCTTAFGTQENIYTNETAR